jgi:methyl coenzyme M reductase subunit C-like uncharacterized protein (methanogenesis marker protein 7)
LGGDGENTPKIDEKQIQMIQNLEKKIVQEFQNETEILTKFHIAEDNLDNLKQSLVKSLGKVDESTQSYLTSLKNKVNVLAEELERAKERREATVSVAALLRRKSSRASRTSSCTSTASGCTRRRRPRSYSEIT